MPVTLIENFRAVFYAPFYAAFALGAYDKEGVDVRLGMSTAADKTLSAILSGTGQVSWGGPMRLLHAWDDNPACGLVSFCEVVGRDPFYLLGREPNTGKALREIYEARNHDRALRSIEAWAASRRSRTAATTSFANS